MSQIKMNVYEAFIWMRVQVYECASDRGGGGAGGFSPSLAATAVVLENCFM